MTVADFAIVSGDFVPTGGMDMPNLALARYLARAGGRAEVVAYRIDESLAALPTVRFHRVPKPLASYFLGSPLLDIAGRKVGRGVLKRGGRVIVNGGNCQLPDVNWVHYLHAAYEPPKARGWRVLKAPVERRLTFAAERAALLRAELVIANSERTKRDLIERTGVASERIRVVYYGVDARFLPAEKHERSALREKLGVGSEPVLAFVGGLGDRRKGFDTLFEAWRSLGRDWNATLLVMGRGAELAAWQARAEQSGLARSIRFLGFRKDVPDVLRACDGVVAPTRYEAFGQAVHEALCCGLPALVSADAGVAELITGDPILARLLIDEPESVSLLARRLVSWRDDARLFRSAALERSETLRKRSWDVMSSEIAALL